MKAKMKADLILLGTSLKLHRGERVILTPAKNLPPTKEKQFFARPLRGLWLDGVKRSLSDSILVKESDFELTR